METRQTSILLALFALTRMACTHSAASVDASADLSRVTDDVVVVRDSPDDLAPRDSSAEDVTMFDAFDAVERDHPDAGAPKDRAAPADAMDVARPGCVPGMSVACACTDGRTGAQVCVSDNSFGPCVCTGPRDAGTPPDVVLPTFGARLIAPQSVSRVTSRRPTLRWVLPTGVNRARVTLCADRPCMRVLQQTEVTGTSWRSTTLLAPGVVFWRVEGLATDSAVTWTSATWEFVVGHRDAPVDTSFGSLRDFDGDGFDDFAVAERSGQHAVQIHWGSGNRDAAPSYSRVDFPLVQRGRIVLGDLNGDGLADLVRELEGQNAFWVRYGTRAQRAGGVTMFRHPLFPGTSGIGPCAPLIADLNGDGFSDLTFVCQEEGGSSLGQTTLRVYLGRQDGIAQIPSLQRAATEAGPYRYDLERNVASGGDVNGDGYADLLAATAVGEDINTGRSGPAWILFGDPTATLRWWLPFHPPARQRDFADEIGAPGDVNGDGIADFVLSTGEGALLYLGRSGPVPTTPIQTIRTPERGCGTYWAAPWGLAGDYDGDGRADLTAGSTCYPSAGLGYRGPGAAFIYSGTESGVAEVPVILNGRYQDDEFGHALGGIGDHDGDGYGDLMVLKPFISDDWDSMMPYVGLPAVFVFWGRDGGISPGTRRVIQFPDISVLQEYLAERLLHHTTRS